MSKQFNILMHDSQLYDRNRQLDKALNTAQTATGDLEKEITALRNQGLACVEKEHFESAMLFFQEALDKCEATGIRGLHAQLQVDFGMYYYVLYNYDEAARQFLSVLEEKNDFLADEAKAVIYSKLGHIYFSNNQPKKALACFDKVYLLAQGAKDQVMAAVSLAQLSMTKIRLKWYTAAAQDAKLAEAHFKVLGEVEGYQINLLNQGNLAYHQQRYELTAELATDAIKVAAKFKDDATEAGGLKLLSESYKALGEFEKALVCHEHHAELSEKLIQQKSHRRLLDAEIRHAFKEKQMEQQQLASNSEFNAALLQKDTHISRLNEELRLATDELRQFAHIASHDLKEPLRMISSFTQIIQRLTEQHLNETQRQYFDFVTEGVTRMNSLLDGLLKYASVTKNGQVFEKVDLNEILRVCQANLQLKLREAGTSLKVGALPSVHGTPHLLSQLFQNLLSNALKFRKDNEPPVIHISAAGTVDEWIVSVSDQGIGIAEAYSDKIFEIFQRLHPHAEFDGAGIGLAICKKIMKRLDGRIWVESRVGEGATFYVAFPKQGFQK